MKSILRLSYLCTSIFTILAVSFLFAISIQVQTKDKSVRSLKAKIMQEKIALAHCEAEWASLSSPHRLSKLLSQKNMNLDTAPLFSFDQALFNLSPELRLAQSGELPLPYSEAAE